MYSKFKATIEIIGINPYVSVPDKILQKIFVQAGKDKGFIPIKGMLDGRAYKQTLVKYKGAWRLYINTTMLKRSPERVGEQIAISVAFDPEDRTVKAHPKLVKALKGNKEAKAIFDGLTASLQKEIVRYIASLKTPESVERNVQKAINFLLGKERFIGRDKP